MMLMDIFYLLHCNESFVLVKQKLMKLQTVNVGNAAILFVTLDFALVPLPSMKMTEASSFMIIHIMNVLMMIMVMHL